ncbi:winged helix-turn-helix transcriptional regulator [bacterium]|nr:winged helix-turn-helix transcriptional regulator [candidate division CSSED10-310 bacterium]
MDEFEKQSRIFKILSVSTRVRMISLLKERPLCVNALAHALTISAPAVSQHLRILRAADIVIADKRGYFVHYRINEEVLTEWNRITRELLSNSQDPETRENSVRISESEAPKDTCDEISR